MKMRQKLEFQADRIETVLALHKVPARVTGGTVTPRWVRFQVLPAVGAKISRIKNLSEELAAALDASNCRVSRRGASVAVEVPRDDPQPVRLLPLYSQLVDESTGEPTTYPSVPPITAILGLAEDGAPLLIRLPSPDVAHILVAGTTGSGKTVLLQSMILSLAMGNPPPSPWNGTLTPPVPGVAGRSADGVSASEGGQGEGLSLVLIDPKGHAFNPFKGLPHLARPIICEVDEMAEVLQSLIRLMERRGIVGGLGEGLGMGRQARVVVVIDELADLLMVGGRTVQQALTRLTQRGREAGIHFIAATQKPTAAVLGSLVKANFPVRLTGRVTSIEDARTATGWSGTGAERLIGRGDFLAVAEGRITRFQGAHISPAEIREVVTYLAQGESAFAGFPFAPPRRQPSLPQVMSRLAGVLKGGM